MLRLGLTARDWAAYVAHLRSDHTASAAGRLYTLNRDPVQGGDFSTRILGGQVDIDTTRTPVRSATVDVWDPNHGLHVDTDSPADGAIGPQRLVRLAHTTYVPALGRAISCPLITGPVTGFARDGDTVTLTVDGMETLATGSAWTTRHFAPGTKKTAVIRSILQDQAGENRLAGISDLSPTLPKPGLAVHQLDQPWAIARRMADALDRQLYYNADGAPILRTYPARPVFTIYDGDQGLHRSDTLAPVQRSLARSSDWYDTIEVLGKKPPKHKPRPHYVASQPFLYRNGVPLRRAMRVEDDKLKTVAACKTKAQRLLAQHLLDVISLTVDTLVFPFLEEGDLIRIVTDDGAWPLRMQQWSIPLQPSEDGMAIGYQPRRKRPTPPRPGAHRGANTTHHHHGGKA